MKWTQRADERRAHLNYNPDIRKDMTNIYLTDSYEQAIVDFVKDHEELHNKTNMHFLATARML